MEQGSGFRVYLVSGKRTNMPDNPLDPILNAAENLGAGELVEGLLEKAGDLADMAKEGPLGGLVDAAKDAVTPVAETAARFMESKSERDEA